MFFHPANFSFFFLLTISILLIISSNSWVIIWLCLEINILMFIPLMFKKSSKYQNEVAIKYFIIQAIASIIILLSITKLFMSTINPILLMSAIMLKIGAAPLHMWVPALVEGLTWKNFFLLMTTQKIGPIIILASNMMSMLNNKLIYFFIWSGALFGSLTALVQSSLRKILTFSSINHMSWVLVSLLMSKSMWMFYFFVYSWLMFILVLSFKKNNMNKLSNLLKKNSNQNILTSINLLSLGGLPPLTGFLPKFLVISKTILTSASHLLIPIILGSLISLFFYLRLAFNSFFILKASPLFLKKTTKMSKNIYPVIINMIGFILVSLLILLFLDFKLTKL